jgi:hypothetical protein
MSLQRLAIRIEPSTVRQPADYGSVEPRSAEWPFGQVRVRAIVHGRAAEFTLKDAGKRGRITHSNVLGDRLDAAQTRRALLADHLHAL